MRIKKTHTKTIILMTLFISVIAAGIGYKPYLAFREEQALYDKIQMIKQGNKALMIETIWGLEQQETKHQKILSVGLRREIITFYRDRIRAVFRPREGLYDYPQAINLINRAKVLYPDSVAISTIEDQATMQKTQLMKKLISLYKRYVAQKKLVRTSNGEDLTTVIPLIERVDPNHYLLRDKKLADLYLSEAEKNISKGKYKNASNYIATGIKLFPEDVRLQSLNKQINAQSQN
jgi:hypothetical protein